MSDGFRRRRVAMISRKRMSSRTVKAETRNDDHASQNLRINIFKYVKHRFQSGDLKMFYLIRTFGKLSSAGSQVSHAMASCVSHGVKIHHLI
jgi:hypothetical protein